MLSLPTPRGPLSATLIDTLRRPVHALERALAARFGGHGSVIGEQAIVFCRTNHADWRTNLSRGAQAERIEPSDEMLDWARRAGQAVGASLAGVDLIQDRTGNWYVLEVNAVPGWKATASALDIDIGRLVVDYLARLVQLRQGR